ncbi:N2,N2-dimethylguanosine tRNA methyltransferase-domain-containing protein [Phlyctochytrium arcticum]|nr:N2,N2-dimethylguanosine tRNA methyltransferase-domain-containing protein [Phlyctochytrium arcticum]
MSRVVNAYVDHFRELSEEELSVIDLNDPKYEDHQIRVLEALSATGLRSIRYAKDLPRISKIFANDLLPEAVRAITENCKHNGVEDIVQGNEGDANAVMYRSIGTPFEVIDLDPYGSASPFLDAAVQAVSDGGLLCITCTDMAVLAGSQSEACWAKYGGMSIPNAPYCHEMGLRLLVHAIQTSAAKYKRCIEPLLCLSIDFYVRVFVKVFTSAQLVKKTASKSSLVYHCTGCKSFVTQSMGKSVELGDGKKVGPVLGPKCGERCEHCDSRFHVGGPFWNGPLHNQEFVRRILKDVKAAPAEKYKTRSRILGMLTVASEELPIPFYYHVPSLAASLKCSAIPLAKICSALLNMGYKVSSSQCASNCFKTNAPGWAVWDVMRQNAKDVPIKNPSAVAKVILGKEIRHVVNWEPHPGANPESRRLKLVRYQENPTANWGPMVRPTCRA